MIADYHIHTPYCGHAMGKTIEYIESAIDAGIAEIGFSDHLGRYYLSKLQKKRYWDWGMKDSDIPRYFSELLDLKETFEGKIVIKIGLEVDYIEGAEHLFTDIVSPYPFDFFLGSIHCLPLLGWRHISQYSKVNVENVYAAYFDAVDSALSSQMIQALAHIDFIWRYVDWPEVPYELMSGYISRAVSLAVQNNVAIELNANGYLWSQIHDDRQFDVFDLLLNTIKTHNASITLGSDAHTPQLVGKAFPQILELLAEKEIYHLSTFDQKKNLLVIAG